MSATDRFTEGLDRWIEGEEPLYYRILMARRRRVAAQDPDDWYEQRVERERMDNEADERAEARGKGGDR